MEQSDNIQLNNLQLEISEILKKLEIEKSIYLIMLKSLREDIEKDIEKKKEKIK